MCEPLGLWCAAYSSGLIALRGLRALSLGQDPADRPASDTQLLPLICSLQVQPCSLTAWPSRMARVLVSFPELWATSRATRGAAPPQPRPGALARPAVASTMPSQRPCSPRPCGGQGDRNTILMVGGEIGLISASENGAVLMWPESDLRQAAEGAGFDIPTRRAARKETTRLRDESRAANRVANATMVRAQAHLAGMQEAMQPHAHAGLGCRVTGLAGGPHVLPCACLVTKLPGPACCGGVRLHGRLMHGCAVWAGLGGCPGISGAAEALLHAVESPQAQSPDAVQSCHNLGSCSKACSEAAEALQHGTGARLCCKAAALRSFTASVKPCWEGCISPRALDSQTSLLFKHHRTEQLPGLVRATVPAPTLAVAPAAPFMHTPEPHVCPQASSRGTSSHSAMSESQASGSEGVNIASMQGMLRTGWQLPMAQTGSDGQAAWCTRTAQDQTSWQLPAWHRWARRPALRTAQALHRTRRTGLVLRRAWSRTSPVLQLGRGERWCTHTGALAGSWASLGLSSQKTRQLWLPGRGKGRGLGILLGALQLGPHLDVHVTW